MNWRLWKTRPVDSCQSNVYKHIQVNGLWHVMSICRLSVACLSSVCNIVAPYGTHRYPQLGLQSSDYTFSRPWASATHRQIKQRYGKYAQQQLRGRRRLSVSPLQWQIQRGAMPPLGGGGAAPPRSPCPNFAIAKVCRIQGLKNA